MGGGKGPGPGAAQPNEKPCCCVTVFPLAWPSLILWGFSLGAGPEDIPDIPAVVLRRNLSASDWAEQIVRCLEQKGKRKKKKKRTFSFKRREKKRKEERIFAEFLKNQFVDSSSIYVERNFSPSSCAKTWIFVTTPHHHTSIRRALLLLALTVCKNRIHPFILLWKMTSEGERGRRLFELEDACSDVVAFAKNLYWCWKLEKKIHPEFILSWQELWFSVFRYCGKCFLAFFSDFISPPSPPFLKK